MISIKGSILRSRLALVDDIAPDGGRARVLARLTAGERETMTSLLASSWYPFELGKKLDEAIARRSSRRARPRRSARPTA
jgi:hypothetical protein